MRTEADKEKLTPEKAQEVLAKWKREFSRDGLPVEPTERAQRIIAEVTGVQPKEDKPAQG